MIKTLKNAIAAHFGISPVGDWWSYVWTCSQFDRYLYFAIVAGVVAGVVSAFNRVVYPE